jgi:riboflavin biosynthesis pyrimidine reductase
MLRARLIDRVAITIAPKILGDGIPAFGPMGITTMSNALTFTAVETQRVGDDVWMEGEVCYR